MVLLLPRGGCTIEQVARFMGITRRTLHRRLALEGQTFIALVQAMRQELWSRYACDRHRSLTEVAQLLGFSDLSSFSRWHRGVFGKTAESMRSAQAGRP